MYKYVQCAYDFLTGPSLLYGLGWDMLVHRTSLLRCHDVRAKRANRFL